MTEQKNTLKAPVAEHSQKARLPLTEATYVPEVDISEDAHQLRLIADMPGVDKSSVDVTVQSNVLTIEGAAKVSVPEGCELIGQEYSVGRFRREFTLSDQVDTKGIKARVSHGVLDLTIPKREEVKTKKIEIEA